MLDIAEPTLRADDVVELVFAEFAAQGIAVDTEEFGGARLVAAGALEGAANESLFEFGDGIAKADAAVNQVANQRFQLIFHDGTLRARLTGGAEI